MATITDNTETAYVYARALFELASEQQAVEAVWKDLQTIQETADTDGFELLAAHPGVTDSMQEAILQKVTAHIGAHTLTQHSLTQLARHGRLNIVSSVVEAYKALMQDASAKQHVRVVTASPASAAAKKSINDTLKNYFNREVELQLETDASILGGMVVYAGNTRMDASVAGKLNRLQQHLKSATA